MLESLRGLGYSTSSALADIIDNSVSAGASTVCIDFAWDGPRSVVRILDDGSGMSDAELESAMRLGDRNPLETRASHDLGRFGMGLKTASLSQCRRLTVASVRDGERSCLRWDLDELARSRDGGWLLFEGAASGSESLLDPLAEGGPGTIVVWELLDRVITPGYSADDFLRLIDDVERHLAMVFHRLIAGPHPDVTLRINGKAVAAWDPFMSGHPAKPWTSPVARRMTELGQIEVQCHVLPHKDKLTSAEYERNAGPLGWTAQQGFYVYRNRRLLVAGGWLGLGAGRAWIREESHQLARIRLDIPNTADEAWKIDVRKSTARPPVAVRPWLTRLAEDTRERARRVFAWRGTPAASARGGPVDAAWQVQQTRDGVRYRISAQHPAIAAVLESAGEHKPLVKAMLRVIEETVPVQRIWLDTVEQRETPRTGFSGEPPEAVRAVLETLFADMVQRKGMQPAAARQALLRMDPFQNFPDAVSGLRLPETGSRDTTA